MNKLTKPILGVAVSGLLALGVQNAGALSITPDVILADNPAGLSASIEMTAASATHLIITIVNTSTGGVGGAGGLLSGLAFMLPSTHTIVSGTATVAAGSTVLNNVNPVPGGNNVSGEWGYQNAVAGHFNGLAVNRQVSTMQADTDTLFSTTRIDPPSVLDGPEWGLVRTGGDPGGNAAIMNSIVIDLTLSASMGGNSNARDNFLRNIDLGTVAVTFGSPENGTTVPDGGSTLILLGLALGAIGRFGWRRS